MTEELGQELTAKQQTLQQQRYGSSRDRSWSGKIVVITILLGIVGLVGYISTQWNNFGTADVSATPSGFEAPDDHTLRFWVDVTRKEKDKPAYCVVRALNYSVEEVGRREFLIPAGGSETQRFTVDIPTTERAVAGKVYGCSSVMPDYLNTDSQH